MIVCEFSIFSAVETGCLEETFNNHSDSSSVRASICDSHVKKLVLAPTVKRC